MKHDEASRTAITLFVWEGVTNYLTAEAVDSILCWCSKAASRSRIVFTYVDKKVLTKPESFYGTRRIIKVLQDVGERWTFGIDPSELASYLAEHCLRLETDVAAAQYRKLYFKEASSKMKGYEFYRVATASI
jgi:O-methyltransferase involved in polyketide biosynthesis